MRKNEKEWDREREMFCVCAYVWMYVCEGFSDSQWGYYWLYSSIISQRLACGTYICLVHWVSSWADLISTFEFSSLSPAQNKHYIQPFLYVKRLHQHQKYCLKNLRSSLRLLHNIKWSINTVKTSSSITDHCRVGDIVCAFPPTVSTFLPLSSPFLSYALLCPWLCGSRVPICLAS